MIRSLDQCPDAESYSLLCRAADLRSRNILLTLAETLYAEIRTPKLELRKCRGVAALIHANLYLQDRLAYELYPPPSKMAIPITEEIASA